MRSRINTLAALMVTAVSSEASAQAECKTIRDDEARLSCYDTTFGVAEVAETTVTGMGKWQVSTEVSQLTDDKNVFARLDSEDRIPGQFGGAGPARLWLRCMENTTAVIFDFNDNFMADIQGYGEIEYRLDEGNLSSFSATASTDNKSLGLWRGAQSIPFIQRMLDKDRLIVRATPFNESPVTVTFDIRGIEAATAELRETCNW